MRSICSSALFLAACARTPVAERYASVLVGQDGRVTVVAEDGRRETPTSDSAQVGAEQAEVAPDHESVGWLALYPNCCTTYPLPLKLMILNNGKLRALKGESGEPVWRWRFQGGGTLVAFKEEAPHGSAGVHYELWDVRGGRRVADYSPQYDQNGRVAARPNEPQWVRELDMERR
jgi:hypothetical protein